MRKTGEQPESVDESYTIPVGKTRTVRNHYNGVRADFADASGRKLTIEVRAFDDGVAFRYMVPEQPAMGQVRIAHELTEFTYAKDASTYPLILDGYQSSWEDEYQLRNVSGLHQDWLIGLPFLANVPGVGWAAITEADIENYSGMYLRRAGGFLSHTLRADLSPHADQAGTSTPSYAVETATPFSSPWRVLMIADEPGKLIESNIVLNLNPPSKIADTSWIKAGKSAWDWWSGEAAPSVSFKTGHEYGDDEALHRLCVGVGIPLHADRRGMGGEGPDFDGRCAAAGRHHANVAEYRHAGAAALRKREEREDLAVGALDVGGQVHGPGVSAL